MLNCAKTRTGKGLEPIALQVDRIDHLGTVTGIIQDLLGLVAHIDKRIPPAKRRKSLLAKQLLE